jgi:SPP1 gp7 family putative phage head morphogenesis protein
MDILEFIKSLYDYSDENIKDVYKAQKGNRDELLKAIADIMLTYTVVNNIMSLGRKEKSETYNNLSKLIINSSKAQAKDTEKFIRNTLTNTAEKTFNHYSYNAGLKDVQDIINDNFKGKHFSERVWDNETEIAKHLHKQVNDFLQGKINVNQIKSNIEKTFNADAYNVKRLAETEISRVQNESFKRLCSETGVKKVKYNATLDSKTCNDCAEFDGKVYDFGKEPGLPRHPMCRCFYEIADDTSKVSDDKENKKQPLVMNLQLFAIAKDEDNLKQLIQAGRITQKQFDEFQSSMRSNFNNGIDTPLGVVRNNKKAEYHIIYRHSKELLSVQGCNRIKETLETPDIIRKCVDKFGNENNGYLKTFNGKTLLVVAKGDIITSYYPTKKYIKNHVERWDVLWEKT